MSINKQYINWFRDFLIQNHAKADYIRMWNKATFNAGLDLSFNGDGPKNYFDQVSPIDYIMMAFSWSSDYKMGALFWSKLNHKWRWVLAEKNVS